MNDPAHTLVLASGSPRRRQMLEKLGFSLEISAANLSEEVRPNEAAEAYVRRVAMEKANAVSASRPGRVVLAADTSVVVDGRIFGKPADEADAVRMLKALAGRAHLVLTGVHVSGPRGACERVVQTTVRFRPISEAEARWYAKTGEPLDKAGGYGIQDRGGMFVAAIEGSYSNVVGLPLAETLELLAQAGLRLPWETAGSEGA